MTDEFSGWTPIAELYAKVRAEIPKLQLWDEGQLMDFCMERYPEEWAAAARRYRDIEDFRDGRLALKEVRHAPDQAKLRAERPGRSSEFLAGNPVRFAPTVSGAVSVLLYPDAR